MFDRNVREVLNLYNPANPLEKAYTIPAPWYFDSRIETLERSSVFAANWQVVGRLDLVKERGQFFTIDVNEEPLIVVRSDDGNLRAFYNVCRHHAATEWLRETVSLSLSWLDLWQRRRAKRNGGVRRRLQL